MMIEKPQGMAEEEFLVELKRKADETEKAIKAHRPKEGLEHLEEIRTSISRIEERINGAYNPKAKLDSMDQTLTNIYNTLPELKPKGQWITYLLSALVVVLTILVIFHV